MKIDKNTKIVKYIIVIALVAIVFFGIRLYKENSMLGTIKNTLKEYFENNNEHISSRDFDINDVTIKCNGNDAYIVEFNLSFNDNIEPNELKKLGATIYKNNDKWYVKGFGKGLTTNELKQYNFKCYN